MSALCLYCVYSDLLSHLILVRKRNGFVFTVLFAKELFLPAKLTVSFDKLLTTSPFHFNRLALMHFL